MALMAVIAKLQWFRALFAKLSLADDQKASQNCSDVMQDLPPHVTLFLARSRQVAAVLNLVQVYFSRAMVALA